MDIKRRLQQYADMKLEHEQLKERIEAMRDQLISIHSQSFDGIVAPAGNSDKIGNMVANLNDLETLYIRRSNEIMREMINLERIINNNLEPLERVIVRKKYFESKTWETICVEMNYSYRGIQNIHSRIIQKLRKSA